MYIPWFLWNGRRKPTNNFGPQLVSIQDSNVVLPEYVAVLPVYCHCIGCFGEVTQIVSVVAISSSGPSFSNETLKKRTYESYFTAKMFRCTVIQTVPVGDTDFSKQRTASIFSWLKSPLKLETACFSLTFLPTYHTIQCHYCRGNVVWMRPLFEMNSANVFAQGRLYFVLYICYLALPNGS
jgi:hypothetical protein